MEWLESMTAAHWLILGLVLLALEVGAGLAYLLGVGLGAIAVAAVFALVPLSPLAQFTLFAISSVIATIAYARFFKNRDSDAAADGLHNRLLGMVGNETTLTGDVHGNERIAFGDTLWRVRSDKLISAGSKVRVVGVEDDILLIEALPGA